MKPAKPTLCLAAALGLFLSGAPPCLATDREWTITTLDAEGDVGKFADLQLAPDGDLHAVYWRDDDNSLKIITSTDGVWDAPTVIDDSGWVDGSCALGVSGSGDLPVSYRRSDTEAIWFAGAQDPPSWSVEPVTTDEDNVGPHLDAVLRGTDGLALAYRNETDGALMHIRREADLWTEPQTVDPGPGRGIQCDLAYRDGVGYAFSAYAQDQGGHLSFADPEITPQAWDVEPITSDEDNVGPHLDAVLHGTDGLALAYRNETDGALMHIRREADLWTEPQTVDPGPGRGKDCDLAYREGVGYAFSAYAEDQDGHLSFADPEIEPNPWLTRIVDRYVDVGKQVSMIQGPEGRLDYVWFGYDQWKLGQIRAGELRADSVRILRVVEDSLAASSNAEVHPDLFLTPGQDWYVSFRNDTDGYLYFAKAESLGISPQDVDIDPTEVRPGLVNRLLGASPSPSTQSVTVHYEAARAGDVALRVYDASGRLVSQTRSRSEPGRNQIAMNGRALPAGLYFLRLQVGADLLGPKRISLVR